MTIYSLPQLGNSTHPTVYKYNNAYKTLLSRLDTGFTNV